MALPLVTTAVALFYLGAVPLRIVMYLHLGQKTRFGLAIAPFEARFARKIALKRQSGQKKPPLFLRNMRLLPSLKAILRAARFLFRHIRLDRVEMNGAFGTDDAAATAWICGGLYALGTTIGCATRKPILLNVRPDFSGGALHADLNGMISVRVGHIILAALLGAYEYVAWRLKEHG